MICVHIEDEVEFRDDGRIGIAKKANQRTQPGPIKEEIPWL
jgi:hypothetical protein